MERGKRGGAENDIFRNGGGISKGGIGIGRPLPVAILIDDLFSIVVATSATDPRFDLETFVDEKTYFPTIDRSRIYIYLVSRSILCSSSTMKYVLSRIELADVSVEEREEGSSSPLRSQILSTRDKIANTKFHNRKLDRERKKREKICSSSETCFSWSIVITVPCPVSRL